MAEQNVDTAKVAFVIRLRNADSGGISASSAHVLFQHMMHLASSEGWLIDGDIVGVADDAYDRVNEALTEMGFPTHSESEVRIAEGSVGPYIEEMIERPAGGITEP